MNTVSNSQPVASGSSEPITPVVVGVDGSRAGKAAVGFARCLGLRASRFVLVNVVESPMPDGSYPPANYAPPLASWVREREEQGRMALVRASETFAASARLTQHQERGFPAEVLMRVASENRADLIVVGHHRQDAFEACVLGSTPRELIRKFHHHLLIVRGHPPVADEMVAVFATDESPAARKCLDELIRLGPAGLKKIYVLTVNEIDAGSAAMLVRGLPHLRKKAEEWVERGMRDEADAQCAKLRAAGFAAEPLIVEGTDVALAITKAANSVKASLAIVASEPHGFWDRLMNGSVTEELLRRDRRSLFVLRPEHNPKRR